MASKISTPDVPPSLDKRSGDHQGVGGSRLASMIAKASVQAKESGNRIELADPEQKGLRIRVAENKTGTWSLQCRNPQGAMRRFVLGAYPGLGISEARKKARALREQVRNGFDPIRERRAQQTEKEKEERNIGRTLRWLFDEYETKGNGGRLRSWPGAKKRLSSIMRALMDKPLGKLALSDFQSVIDNYQSAISGAWAVRTIRPIFRWASAPGREFVPEQFVKISSSAKPARRNRTLNEAELKAVWNALLERGSTNKLNPTRSSVGCVYYDGMQLMLMTLLRKGEVEKMRWKDVDLAMGRVVVPQTKNGQPHIVPLSTQAIDLLEARYIAAKENKTKSELVFCSASGGAVNHWNDATKDVQEKSGTSQWHRHDLRRTGATLLGENGFEPHVIEAALNHVAIHSVLAATYNQARYRPQVAQALQWLGDYLEGLSVETRTPSEPRSAGALVKA